MDWLLLSICAVRTCITFSSFRKLKNEKKTKKKVGKNEKTFSGTFLLIFNSSIIILIILDDDKRNEHYRKYLCCVQVFFSFIASACNSSNSWKKMYFFKFFNRSAILPCLRHILRFLRSDIPHAPRATVLELFPIRIHRYRKVHGKPALVRWI